MSAPQDYYIGKRVVIKDETSPYNEKHGVVAYMLQSELGFPTWARVTLDGIELSYRESWFPAGTVMWEELREEGVDYE